MDPALIDPNNHAPAVTPDDVWGDAAACQASQGATARSLPPKKIKTESAQPAATANHRAGLRLGSDAPSRISEPAGQPLEVHEIDGSVVRLEAETPTSTKVPRQFTFHHKPAATTPDRPHQGENKEWGRSRQQSIRWLVATGAGVTTLVALALLLLPWINQANAVRLLPGQETLMLDPADQPEDNASLNDMLTRQAAAEQIFRAYASATIVADMLPLVRDAEVVQPLIRARLRPAMVSKAWLPPADTCWNVFASHGKPCGLLEGSLPDYSKFSAYLIMAENNQLQLDWKATTGYGTATFEELQRQQGDPAEIRGTILPAGFFTATFPEATYQSYQLVAPCDDKSIWCYTRRGDTTDAAISKLFANNAILDTPATPQKVTLRLEHGPAGTLSNQWLIAEMRHKDWITP